MVALCRAKCWIIQLREDDSDGNVPFAQRGVRGHIIVYPQRPSAIAKTLPPSLSDVTTPICVVFVGSKPPTAEWLKDKVKPLTVRKERVMDALAWLKIHNHLYRDVPDEAILPFHIQHVIPNTGIDITTSDYVPGSSQPAIPNLADILSPPPSTIPFQSVVITDVDGNAPPNELRSAALRWAQPSHSALAYGKIKTVYRMVCRFP
ncbi:hypothetical protein C8F04DRAFT_974022 [Mycena alexandri]|uniref:DUF6570 domain-containing protein n=1 Tax=Mycena alexandri TaxID=1745969 RepID=A0AAD6S4I3_9AGAR|nr:hypothetical protein C8F04DRAFT_974022 [Mycena alexandri]